MVYVGYGKGRQLVLTSTEACSTHYFIAFPNRLKHCFELVTLSEISIKIYTLSTNNFLFTLPNKELLKKVYCIESLVYLIS